MKVWHQYCNHLNISHSLNSPSRFLCCWHQYCNCLNRFHFFDAPSRFSCCNSWHTAYSRVAFMIGSASRAAKMAIQMLATRAPHYPSQTTMTIQHIYPCLPVLRFCLHLIGALQRYPALSFKFNLGSRGGRSFMLPSKSWLVNMKFSSHCLIYHLQFQRVWKLTCLTARETMSASTTRSYNRTSLSWKHWQTLQVNKSDLAQESCNIELFTDLIIKRMTQTLDSASRVATSSRHVSKKRCLKPSSKMFQWQDQM
jgi:hypothetical protein